MGVHRASRNGTAGSLWARITIALAYALVCAPCRAFGAPCPSVRPSTSGEAQLVDVFEGMITFRRANVDRSLGVRVKNEFDAYDVDYAPTTRRRRGAAYEIKVNGKDGRLLAWSISMEKLWVIYTPEQLITVDGRGAVTCKAGDRKVDVKWLIELMEKSSDTILSKTVTVTSVEAFLNQLGF